MATLQDRIIKCVDCGEEFTFTVGEQEFYRDHGLASAPTRCKRCRENRKGPRAGGAGRGGAGAKGRGGKVETRQMFPAVCSECGAQTQVPFKPTGERPVYCRDCFAARKPAAGAGRERQPSHSGAPRPATPSRPRAPQDGPRMQGAVRSFNEAKGFGFIRADGGEEVFVHFSAISGDGFRALTQGDRVEFDVVEGPKGKQAANVDRI